MNARVKGEKEKERQRVDTLKMVEGRKKSGETAQAVKKIKVRRRVGQNASAKKLSARDKEGVTPKQSGPCDSNQREPRPERCACACGHVCRYVL